MSVAKSICEPTATQAVINPIPGFNGYYARSDGSIWSDRRGGLVQISENLNTSGYRRVNLTIDHKNVSIEVHSLILFAFEGPRPKGMQACHGDGDKLNNRSDNLQWGTPKENCEDRGRHGNWTAPIGDNSPTRKLSSEQVLQVVARCHGGESRLSVAASLGVRKVTIHAIMQGRNWSQVTGIEPASRTQSNAMTGEVWITNRAAP